MPSWRELMQVPPTSPGATGHTGNIHVSLSYPSESDNVADMGLGDPEAGSQTQYAEQPPVSQDGCFSNCPTCRRLRKATAEFADRHGVEGITSAAIAEFAGVPLERAAEHYPTLDACLAATYDEGSLRLRRVCVRALRGRGSWPERLRAVVDAGIEEFETRPELARFCMIAAWRSDLPVLCASRLAARERLVAILAEESGVGDECLPDLRFEILVGAAHHTVSEEIHANGGAQAVRERLDQVIELFEPVPS
jgi:AcrR family transcriptional regulator